MPEGPSLVIARELAAGFAGKKVLRVEGNTTIDKDRLLQQRLIAVRSWGKHLLLEFKGFSLRIHFLMFGTYRINERKEGPSRLGLGFARGQELNFYTCSVRYVEGALDDTYDWAGDVMADSWDAAKARRKLRAMPGTLVCDVLLDQDVFAGVGNIIKNEVLFRIRVHPLSTVGALPVARLRDLVAQAREYSFDFLAWKKAFELKKHWLVHTKRKCPNCEGALTKAYLGKTNRRSFFCETCQTKHVSS
ncbi:MAG TPA: DNA-formamidopyrimidine glycosylase family protein [Polaromonas sp.]|uniref:DNA-formamidopyrimidine glycosylase family protein n=1 Tax=Polaromonas sp. TaxID=1869339 RepID=UPI002D6896AF|nr:DNA-formamidopyrimidine glycosylase family protein [Polaromonas sp.]HYW57925.1 DNA-formamidopyrimidine glycosylase family protein [Polaromonas sp.]